MTNTPAAYPTSVTTFTIKTNKVDVVNDDDVNKLQNEVVALQTYIGTNPHGSKVNLTTRLGVTMATNGCLAQGTAYPTLPSDGQIFYRTDLDTAAIYSTSAAAWQVLGNSLSNVMWSYSGFHLSNTINAFYVGPSLAAATLSTNYAYWQSLVGAGDQYQTCILTKFLKIAGISTITSRAYVWQANASGGVTAGIKISIGSTSATGLGSANQVTPQAITIINDVSGLANGTVYDVPIQLGFNSGTGMAIMGSIIGIAT